MNLNLRSVARVVCGATGAVIAGPGGAFIGDLVGGLLAGVLPGSSMLVGGMIGKVITKAVEESSFALRDRLTESERQRINHDLQTAFRDSLAEALYDLGGERCFPKTWKGKPRDVPAELVYSLTPRVDQLWRTQDPLAEQVCYCFREMQRALKEQRLLPLDPQSDQPSASVLTYLEAETPQALNQAFFDQVIVPFLAGFGTLTRELPDFEAHLRRHLLDRTLVHLGEALKHRTPAWRAFNRMLLQNLRSQVQEIGEGQEEILERLDALLALPGEASLDELTHGLADLLSATGRIEKQMDENFDVLFGRVFEQHAEVLERFDQLMVVSKRIERKVERVLHILEDGRYVIEGTPSVAIDEPPAPGEPPFKGLQYFDEADADLFFGREMLTAKLVNRLREFLSSGTALRFLAVVGASGSGKSSLVRAGLIPALRRGVVLADGSQPPEGSTRWQFRVMTPTAHPLMALAKTLAQGEHLSPEALCRELSQDAQTLDRIVRQNLGWQRRYKHPETTYSLLFIDQFEELFTLCRDESERQTFIGNLMNAVSSPPDEEERVGGFVLVLALRADFYAHCAQYASLREALEKQQDYIGPMSPDELRQAIEEPARHGGADGLRWEFEPGLVDLILRDVGNEPGALPLLSHALLETWKHRRGRVMTLESYAEAGGVRGAIAKTAETVYHHRLTAAQRVIARNIFLRLTELGDEVGEGALPAPDTRRRVHLEELVPHPESAPAIHSVLKILADARLITVSEDAVEIAHEALIREWPTLRGWLDEDRASLRLHRQLTEAAQEWAKMGKDTGMVYRGARLKQVLVWAEEHDEQLSPLERDFVTFSKHVADRDAAEREAQRQRELEAAQRLAEEAEARRKAEEERLRLAEETTARLKARNRVITIVGVIATLAALLACLFGATASYLGVQSNRNATLAQHNLATAQAANTQIVAEANTRATAEMNALRQKATAEAARAEALSQKATAEAASLEAQTQSHISLVRELASRAINLLERNVDLGLLLAIEAVKRSEQLNEPIQEAQITLYRAMEVANFAHTLRGHQDLVYQATFSPDGQKIVTASRDKTARIWLLNGAPVATLEGHTDEVLSAFFSPDGEKIVTASLDGTARLWSAEGEFIRTFEGHTAAVPWAIFSPDGKHILTTSFDKTAKLWNLDGNLIAILQGHTDAVLFATFNSDGSRVLTTSADATARLWDRQGKLLATLEGHSRWVNGASFSPDGQTIITASFDGTARLWQADGTPILTFDIRPVAIYTAMFSPDGKWIVTAGDDGIVRLWHSDGSLVSEINAQSGPVTMATFSPDSKVILTAGTDNQARLWRLDGNLITSLQGHWSFINTAIFSRDGRWILTSNADATARLWNVHRLFAPAWTAHSGPVTWTDFSPDGEEVFSGGLDNVAHLWKLDGTLISTFEGHRAGVVGGDFSPDGRLIVTASRDSTARLWRIDGSPLAVLSGHESAVRSASFSPDGEQVLTAGEDGTVRTWRLDGTSLITIQADSGAVWSACYSPDGEFILSGGDDSTAKLWRRDGTLVTTFAGHSAPIWAVGFNPDGSLVVTAGEDGSARLWRRDGTLIAEILGHTGPVSVVRISPDGSLLLTAGQDGTARLWHISPQDSQVTFLTMMEGHKDWVASADFSPDGSKIVTASWDGTLRMWNVYGDVTAMLTEGEQRVGRSLYNFECQQYLHQSSCQAEP